MAKVKRKKPLYTLTPDERTEYVRRHRLMEDAYATLAAFSNYMDLYQQQLIEKHELPGRWEIDLATGHVTEREEAENAQNGSV